MDVDMQDRSKDAMLEGVAHCKSVVIFLTGDKGLFDPVTSPKRTALRGSDALAEWNAKYDKQVEDIMKELTGKGILPKAPKDSESVYYVPVPEAKDYVHNDTDWRKKLLEEEDAE